MSTKLSRPERNNNPGDIRAEPGVTWVGQAGTDLEGFAVFGHRAYGIRAMAIILYNYYDIHDCQTLSQIIERWSPPSENDTDDLITKAAHRMEVHPDDYLELEFVLPTLISTLCYQEDPGNTISANDIAYGMMLAQKHPA